MRTRRFLPKREREPSSLFELDAYTLEWMKMHSVDDITGIAIENVAAGKDPTQAIGLVDELTKIEWKVGIKENTDRIEALEYYSTNQNEVEVSA